MHFQGCLLLDLVASCRYSFVMFLRRFTVAGATENNKKGFQQICTIGEEQTKNKMFCLIKKLKLFLGSRWKGKWSSEAMD